MAVKESGATAPPQNVKSRSADKSKKALSGPKLERTTFRTSREMDFFSAKELVTQTGHEVLKWPLVFLKELVDNALDACEEANIPPTIIIIADACGITVSDNGPGLPDATLAGALDFTVRASNREAYVAPDRGAQGNALKTILPMPVVLDPARGCVKIEALGKRHIITCGCNPISQRAEVNDDVTDLPKSKKAKISGGEKASFIGTSVRMEWGECPGEHDAIWPFEMSPAGQFVNRFRAMVEGFAVFNPHASFSLDWFGDKFTWQATNPNWEKWLPCKPTSAHWYEIAHLERLIGAYITHDRDRQQDRLVSDLLAEFDGLTGSANRAKVLDASELKRVKISEFVVNGRLDSKRIDSLLKSMQRHTRPVKPQRLGIIGEDHLKARLLAMGVQEESFSYTRKLSKDGVPWVLESAFGWMGDGVFDSRRIYAGANWSASIENPFRSFGETGSGLDAALADLMAGQHEPIVMVLHLAHPRVEYTDRGKSALVVGGAA